MKKVVLFLSHPMMVRYALLVRDAIQGSEIGTDMEVLLVVGSSKVDHVIPDSRRNEFVKISRDGLLADLGESSLPPLQVKGDGLLDRLSAKHALATILVRAYRLAQALTRRVRLFSKFLSVHRPDLVVVFNDRTVDTDLSLLKACQTMSVPAVLLSVTQFDPETSAFSRLDQTPFYIDRGSNIWLKQLLYRLLPSETWRTPYGRMLFHPPDKLLGLLFAGFRLRSPWIRGGSGYVRLVGISHSSDVKVMRDFGLDSGVARLVGLLPLDGLRNVMRNRPTLRPGFMAEYGWTDADRLVIWAVPQHWANMPSWLPDDYCALVNAVSGFQVKILLSLHPKARRDDYPYLVESEQARFATGELERILPFADMFIAALTSSTIDWAVSLGIPAIGVDFTLAPMLGPGRWPSLPRAYNASELLERLDDMLGTEQPNAATDGQNVADDVGTASRIVQFVAEGLAIR